MVLFLKRFVLILCVLLPLACAAQISPVLPSGTTVPSPQPDPLGRETPSGSLYGFLQAAQAGNNATAAQYLQLSATRRQSQGEDIASRLKVVIDRGFSGNLRNISNKPEGTPQDGVPFDRQHVGALIAGDVEAELTLVRVPDPSGARIWLISADTLARVPELYDQVQAAQVQMHLPAVLIKNELLGLPYWQWLAMIIGLPIAALIGWLLLKLLRIPRVLWARRRDHRLRDWSNASRPLWLLLAVISHSIIVRRIRLPLLQRHYYQQVAGVFFVIAVTWLAWCILRQVMRRGRERAIMSGRMGTGSLMLLGERILKAALVIVGVFAVLSTLGFNMSTALAGLGIGGIAIAFAAQKTLENLFGGVSVLGDEAIRVGETCRFGDRIGTVEDISLRSTRIRTPERTELSIPNGSLATMNIENFSRRDKVLFNTNIRVRLETSPDQVRYLLAEVRKLLYEHPKVETEGARIRFVGFEEGALTLEIFSYILTRDFADFLAIREDLLLRIMDIIESSGTELAFPSRTLYLGRDAGLDRDRASHAIRQVEQWRQGKQLPFPDYPPAEISEISNSLPYPPPESALRNSRG
jgi:MscS family membrane protein